LKDEYRKPMSKEKLSASLAGIALLSAGVLSLEISLTRVFSAVLRYHFVFLVISIAICGLGIGSMLCSLYKKPENIPLGLAANLFGWSAIAYLIIFFKLILPISPESLWLIASLVVFPFIFAGIFLAGLFSQMPEKSNTLYALDLLGAGLASYLIIAVLNNFGAINACFFAAITAVLAGIAFKKSRIISLVSAALIAVLLVYNIRSLWLDIPPLPTKDTAYAKALFTETELGDKDKVQILHTEWDSFARTDVVRDKSMGDNILLVYTNGNVPTRLIRYFPETNKYAVDANIADIAFELKKPKKVLCIGPGGGLDVLLAKKQGAEEIDGVEINPAIEKIMRIEQFIKFAGRPYEMDGVNLFTADGRTFVKHTDKKYDMIFLSLAKTGTGTFGIALVEGYIYTLEAFEDYLDRLSDEGSFVFVTDGYLMNIRLFNTALEALMRKHNLTLKQALCHVALFAVPENQRGRNPYEYTLIVSKRPFLKPEREKLFQLCKKNNYVPFFIPGKEVDSDFQPLLAPNATLASFTSRFDDLWKRAFMHKNGIKNPNNVPALNLQPVTDDKPFFLDLIFGVPKNLQPLLWGTLILLGLIGTGMYLKVNQLAKHESKSNSRNSFLMIFGYFFALGVAFMLVEIPLIQKMILILGHPTYALTVVLFFLLSGAGTGSYIAGLKRFQKVKKFNMAVCLIVAIASTILLFYLNTSHNYVLSLPLAGRISWSGALSFGLGLFLGMPFPVAMKALGNFNPQYIPWMWCINGFSSLLGSILAAVGAKLIGFHMVFMVGCVFYLLAALCSSEKWGKE